jgi:ribose transport system permease protein
LPARAETEKGAESVTGNGSGDLTPKPGAVSLNASPLAGRIDLVRRYLTRYSLLVLLVFLIVLYSILKPSTFLTVTNLQSMLLEQTVPTVIALAVLVPIVAGGFDLSVGYVLGFTAIVGAKVGAGAIGSGFTAIAFLLVAGLAAGGLNAILVARLRISSFIATLGVGLSISGIMLGLTGGQVLYAGIPPVIAQISLTPILGIDASVWLTLIIVLLVYYLLARLPLGRKMYAIGGNEQVARLAAINVTRIKIIAFVLAGLLSAVGGLLTLGQVGSADPSTGPEFLLPAFAAVFLGATSIRPGFFNVWGTVLAIFVLAVNFSGLTLLGAPYWFSPVIDGIALVIGVLVAGKGLRGVLSG